MATENTKVLPPPRPKCLKVLISGAGVAGPATAFWLARFGCDVTIVERSPQLRTTGQQIDLRGQGIVLMKMMGLESAVRAAVCPEPGVRFVDRHGATKGFWGINKSGKGSQSLTTDWEIMRGDLLNILYDATKNLEGVRYMFDRSIKSFSQDEGSPTGKVHVTFSDDSRERYDILIGADGIGSATRRMMLGPSFPDPAVDTGLHAAFFTAPTQKGDTNDWNICMMAGGRLVMTRQDRPDNIRVYFMTRGSGACRGLDGARTLGEQKAALAALFADATDWHTQRFVRALRDAPEADDLYCQHQSQIRLPAGAWARGRVALVGDAAYCTTIGGVGVSAAFVGGYVLAGEIAKQWEAEQRAPGSFNMEHAAREYERLVRPLIEEHQSSQTWTLRLLLPETRLELWLVQAFIGFVSMFRLDRLLFNMMRNEEPAHLDYPDYFGAGPGK